MGREGWIFSEAVLEHLVCKGVQAVAVDRKAEGLPAVWGERAGKHRERDRVAVDQWDCSCREEPMLLGSSVG